MFWDVSLVDQEPDVSALVGAADADVVQELLGLILSASIDSAGGCAASHRSSVNWSRSTLRRVPFSQEAANVTCPDMKRTERQFVLDGDPENGGAAFPLVTHPA